MIKELELRFTKMHGAGNDYIFIDGRGLSEDWPSVAIAMSNRHTGVGSDGIILALPSSHADVRMVMFNADGSEGKMCGNGIRCLVDFAKGKNFFPDSISPVIVETAGGDRQVTPILENGQIINAAVQMGEPIFKSAEVPVNVANLEKVVDYPIQIDSYSFEITCVSMGNPHAVLFTNDPVDQYPLDKIGPQVETMDIFPEGVNFEIVNVHDAGNVSARVWERGSGLTMACGTGACAIAVVGWLKGLTGDVVTVKLPGGNLTIKWPGYGNVIMEGPVQEVFEGEWRP